MERSDSHPSDEELLLAADGELSKRSANRLRAHLSACWECRGRMRALEAAIADYVNVHRRKLDPMVPPADGPRALLKAQLHALGMADASPSWASIGPRSWIGGLAAVLAICTLAYVGFLKGLPRSPWPEQRHAPATAVITPNARLTPGMAVSTRREEVCRSSPPNNKMVPASVQRLVFKTYGIESPDPHAYEVDYLITPALGGSDDIRNLWPQSYAPTVWNARVKDSLEDRLYELVCTGELDLATAQRDISTDWIAAYRHYFHTDRPIGELSH